MDKSFLIYLKNESQNLGETKRNFLRIFSFIEIILKKIKSSFYIIIHVLLWTYPQTYPIFFIYLCE